MGALRSWLQYQHTTTVNTGIAKHRFAMAADNHLAPPLCTALDVLNHSRDLLDNSIVQRQLGLFKQQQGFTIQQGPEQSNQP